MNEELMKEFEKDYLSTPAAIPKWLEGKKEDGSYKELLIQSAFFGYMLRLGRENNS